MEQRCCLSVAKVLSVLLVLWWVFFVIASHGMSVTSLVESVVPGTVLVVALIAWRWNLAGGIIFVLLGMAYVGWMWGRMYMETYYFVAGPFILTGALFILAGMLKLRR